MKRISWTIVKTPFNVPNDNGDTHCDLIYGVDTPEDGLSVINEDYVLQLEKQLLKITKENVRLRRQLTPQKVSPEELAAAIDFAKSQETSFLKFSPAEKKQLVKEITKKIKTRD